MSNPRLRRRVQYSAALVASALLLASCQNPANQEDKDEASATPTTTSSSTSAEKTSEASSTASSSSSATSSSSASSSATSSSATSGKPSGSHAKQRSDTEGHVVVLSTGGTIASTHDDKGAVVPTVKGSALVDPLYSEFDKDKLELEVKDIANLDSSAMTLADTDKIITAVQEQLERDDVDGVIVTHGTDSMEETAIALDTFHDSDKPVVLTGAMRPFDDADPDGPENLATAVETVTNPDYAGHGAFIAFGGKVIPARGAFKSDTEKADGFATNSQDKFPERPGPLSTLRLAMSAWTSSPPIPAPQRISLSNPWPRARRPSSLRAWAQEISAPIWLMPQWNPPSPFQSYSLPAWITDPSRVSTAAPVAVPRLPMPASSPPATSAHPRPACCSQPQLPRERMHRSSFQLQNEAVYFSATLKGGKHG